MKMEDVSVAEAKVRANIEQIIRNTYVIGAIHASEVKEMDGNILELIEQSNIDVNKIGIITNKYYDALKANHQQKGGNNNAKSKEEKRN